MGTAHERITNGLVPAPRPLTVLIPGSHHVPPLVPTRRNVLSMSKTFAGSRRPLTDHQRVHRSLNAPPCALTVFHRAHEMYHTVAHGRPSRCHVTATLRCTCGWDMPQGPYFPDLDVVGTCHRGLISLIWMWLRHATGALFPWFGCGWDMPQGPYFPDLNVVGTCHRGLISLIWMWLGHATGALFPWFGCGWDMPQGPWTYAIVIILLDSITVYWITGVWLVPCALPPLDINIEMKIVRGWDDNLTWEPFPHENKHVRLMDYSQVINAHWAAKDVSRIGQSKANIT